MGRFLRWLKRGFTGPIQTIDNPVPVVEERILPIEEKIIEEKPKKPRLDKPIMGVDVYHGDIITDWDALTKAVDFIIVKVSEGTTFKDPKFSQYRAEANKRNFPIGFYHFYRSNKDPIAQANNFCNQVISLKVGELCVVCDWETEDDKSDGFDLLEVEKFIQKVEERLGAVPWIYSGWILKQGNKIPDKFTRYPLWLSHYTSKPRPVVPKPWPNELVWQFTENASVPGIKNPCDYNRFNGDWDLFTSFIKK